MQTLFDLPMSSSLSYIIAIAVILGLLALFAFIVRKIAAHGPNRDGSRGRGPRLGVVDTFSLDRNRQLVIIRRDDIEHLLLIGGTNDIVVESNIIRAIGAQAIREPQSPLIQMPTQPAPQFEVSAPQGAEASGAYAQPAVQHPQFTAPQMPRLKPAPPPSPQAYAPMRPVIETDVTQAAPTAPAPSLQAQPDHPPQPAAQAREALNNAELQALAKRLEASIPQVALPKTEQRGPAPAKPVMPQMQVAPQPTTPQSAIPPTVAEPAIIQPQIQPKPSMPAAQPIVQSHDMPQNPLPPTTMQPMPTPQKITPVMPQSRPPIMPTPVQHPTPPMSAPSPREPIMPAPQHAQPPTPEPAKGEQISALDENLRRLLGRKLDPR